MTATTDLPSEPLAAAGLDDPADAADAAPEEEAEAEMEVEMETDAEAEEVEHADEYGYDDEYRPSRLPWILAVVGLIGTLAFGLLWLGARDGVSSEGASASSGTAAEMQRAATSFAKDLTNFDGATISEDFDRITAQAAGDFRSQADQFFSSEVRAQLKEAQASSRGEVRSAFVQTVEGDRGTVFVVVDQTIANNASPEPQADTLRMELGMVQRDGRWKVERVSVLTAPSGGSTTPAGGAAETDGGS